jgi:hypothetical protein
MGIKWDDVTLGVGHFTGDIYIGKVKCDKSGLNFFTDKSGDKKSEVIKAISEHMLFRCDSEKASEVRYTFPGICELRLIDLRERK